MIFTFYRFSHQQPLPVLSFGVRHPGYFLRDSY
jgi:hypothetical protein